MDSRKFNIFLFILCILILFPYSFSQDRTKEDNPYITAIFIGQGIKSTVSLSSSIYPIKAFMTQSKTEMKIDKNNGTLSLAYHYFFTVLNVNSSFRRLRHPLTA